MADAKYTTPDVDRIGSTDTFGVHVFTTPSGIGSTSEGNTSLTPLATGATFTGTGELNNYPDVMVSLTTDNNGTLFFEFSVDGTNWGVFPVEGFEVTAGIHEFHTAVKGPRYFRVRFVNSTGTPTYMRLYTYYGVFWVSKLFFYTCFKIIQVF